MLICDIVIIANMYQWEASDAFFFFPWMRWFPRVKLFDDFLFVFHDVFRHIHNLIQHMQSGIYLETLHNLLDHQYSTAVIIELDQ